MAIALDIQERQSVGQFGIVVWALLAPLLLVNLILCAELIAGLAQSSQHDRRSRAKGAIVIPAHNEAGTIRKTIEALLQNAGGEFKILVVADNCTDRTADIARELGVDVVERQDAIRRGKGFALAFAREALRQSPSEIVIVLDADCRTDSISLKRLARASLETGRPAQAINLLLPSRSASTVVRASTFAFLVKNLVRQRGLQRLAGGVHLTGTGMALPWKLFDQADLASSSIVEDVKLGIELAIRGFPTQLEAGSRVWSPHANQQDLFAQRGRWEGGYMALARKAVPKLIEQSIRKRNLSLFVAGLDLLVPPLTLLLLVNVVASAILAALALAGLSWAPLTTMLVFASASVIALLLAWWREGQEILSGADLLRLPLYLIWKIPFYLSLAREGAPRSWVRTQRPGEIDRES